MNRIYNVAMLLTTITLSVIAGEPISKVPKPLTIGIVQADAIIVPIAMFNNNKWFNNWPLEGDQDTLDLKRLEDIPSKWYTPGESISKRWKYYDIDGISSSVTVSKPILSRNE